MQGFKLPDMKYMQTLLIIGVVTVVTVVAAAAVALSYVIAVGILTLTQ